VIYLNTEEKLKKLYETYEQPMYRIAYAILHNTTQAEDAVSDAFLKIIKNINKINETDSISTKNYIIKIIKSTSINIYRENKNASENTTELDDTAFQISDENSSAEKILNDFESKAEINDFLSKLSPKDREIIILRCIQELSFREISLKLSISEPTARKRFERARKSILKMEDIRNYEKRICSVQR
jgi:RNA polymerase sigma-70 factor (ECF subfamily)